MIGNAADKRLNRALNAHARIAFIAGDGPRVCRREFRPFGRLQFVARQYETHHVTGQRGERRQGEHLVAVPIDVLEHLVHERLRRFVLDVAFGDVEQRADGVRSDAAVHEAHARLFELVDAEMIGGVHETRKYLRLKGARAGVKEVYELLEFEMFEIGYDVAFARGR